MSNIQVLNRPHDHVCDLPPTTQYEIGTEIRCTELVLREGAVVQCGREYTLVQRTTGWLPKRRVTNTFWANRAQDYYGW